MRLTWAPSSVDMCTLFVVLVFDIIVISIIVITIIAIAIIVAIFNDINVIVNDGNILYQYAPKTGKNDTL